MNVILPPLSGVILCAATLHSAVADPAMPRRSPQVQELHAVVTDKPAVIDMLHADPQTWASLPPAAELREHAQTLHSPSAEELPVLRIFEQPALGLRIRLF
jgi:hypothetical protein